ncbi:MAG TPA: hypothetical protein DCR97_08465 [Deltaproteobacteria bacterium]|nr:hypothetical protein [Deltaproteobacteria bacterium]
MFLRRRFSTGTGRMRNPSGGSVTFDIKRSVDEIEDIFQVKGIMEKRRPVYIITRDSPGEARERPAGHGQADDSMQTRHGLGQGPSRFFEMNKGPSTSSSRDNQAWW